MNRDQEL